MNLDFSKGNGLLPVIIQHAETSQVLMLGYMDEAAWAKTQKEGLVTFYSRSKQRSWTKGETSGNTMKVVSFRADCDKDTLLIKVLPKGPACHTGTTSCFAEETAKGFLYTLAASIEQRIDNDMQGSYTNSLYRQGINKIAQKLGEEAVELVIEAKDNDITLFNNEAADLLYHFLILLKAKGTDLESIEQVLKSRA